jgi:hypothetical protein
MHMGARFIVLAILIAASSARGATTGSVPAAAEATFSRVNAALGVELLLDESLWNDSDIDAARRLRLPEESRTTSLSIYRAYPDTDARVLGARPYSVSFYGAQGLPTEIAMVFANKGDFEGFAGVQPSKRLTSASSSKDFKHALERDASVIQSNLTAVLGAPSRDKFGDRNLKEKVARWDWNGHAFLLATPRQEYVSVRIVPTEVADRGGRVSKLSDTDLKTVLATRVKKRENGDVVVSEIPMINQGPKGFCVPATWERCLRYLGIPADMYVLAMAGGTGAGGGTYIHEMVDNVGTLANLYGRKVQAIPSSVTTVSVARYIDKGLPIMWGMQVNRTLNEELTRRAAQRRNVSDWKAWENQIKSCRRDAKKISDFQGAHICMIIGYNKDTDELAISDSWGREFEERWITVDEAKVITLDDLRVVTW